MNYIWKYTLFNNRLIMKCIVNKIIFTNKSKDWKELIKNWKWFYMLHFEVTIEWKQIWISKFYSNNDDEQMLLDKIKVWEEYDIEYKESWIYKNIVSLNYILTIQDFINATKRYWFWFDEEQTWEMVNEMESCNMISECEDIVNNYMWSWALEAIYNELNLIII